MSERQLDVVRERSPPLTRRQTARPRRSVQTASASEAAPQVSATYTQNVVNVGASPQEVIEAQRIAANQAAQAVAERAQILHNEAMAHLEGQAQDVVQATFQEASVTVEQLRQELQASEVKRMELIDLGRVLEQQLKVCRAELVKAEAELNAVRFQLSQSKIEAQVKDREIHWLRQAAPSATDALGQPKFYDLNVASSSSGLGVSSGDSVPQPSSPVADPRVDQLIEAAQQLASRHLKFDPIPDSAASFRAWRNESSTNLVKAWCISGYRNPSSWIAKIWKTVVFCQDWMRLWPVK